MTAHNGIRITILVLYLPYQYMGYEHDSNYLKLLFIKETNSENKEDLLCAYFI